MLNHSNSNESFKHALLEILDRDLRKVRHEIESYSDEMLLWRIEGKVTNSAGSLCLHIIGNLNHFIGSVLGNTAYMRDRHAEFHDRHVPRTQLLQHIDQTILMLQHVIPELKEDSLQSLYPNEVFGYPMNTMYFLIHLSGHLNYHLGQINYHRRLIDC